jgi:hypothetical protein
MKGRIMKVNYFSLWSVIYCLVAGCSPNNPTNNDQEIANLQSQIDSMKIELNRPNVKVWSHLIKNSEITYQDKTWSTVAITDTQLNNSVFMAAYAVTDSGLVNYVSIDAGSGIVMKGDTLTLETAWATNINWPNPPVGKSLIIEAIQK